MRLLVVEDSERLRRSLGEGLRNSGFAVDFAADGEAGLAHATHNDYAVIVLDLMLPKLDGMTLLRRLRQTGCNTHVLILSAKDHVVDRVDGLNGGADDYLAKPFSFAELLARINALVRRAAGDKHTVLRVGPLEVDTAARSVRCAGEPLALSRLEFNLLELLLRRRGRVLAREQIIDQLYSSTTDHESNVLEVLVYGLRRKIGAKCAAEIVVTRRGQGYVIEAE